MHTYKAYFNFEDIKRYFNVPEDALLKCFKINDNENCVEVVYYTEKEHNYTNIKDNIRRTHLTPKKQNSNKTHTDKLEESFYNDVVSNLKQEAKTLNTSLESYRKRGDMNNYIATLKSLRSTLDLIKQYDWQLMYSEYGVVNNQMDELENILNKYNKTLKNKDFTYKGTNDIINTLSDLWNAMKNQKDKDGIINSMTNLVTEIAVWEQNHEGQIRNHKVWTTNIPYEKILKVDQ